MAAINAFVAHSFTPDDEAIIGKFLKFFDRLSKSGIDFSYVHAEAAEPKELAEKVKLLIEDRNVLIAICTSKERVISPEVLVETRFPPGSLKAPRNEFASKTSDWIIQEIGLAIGRGLDLILLLEEGVRKPGGLQGDLEYISFNRESPDQSFGKIIEMLTALRPKGRALELATVESRSAVAEEKATEPPAEDDWWIPQPDWGRRQYDFALMLAIKFGANDKIESIYEAYLATPDAGLRDNRQRWEAYREYLRLLMDKGGTVSKLRELAETNSHSVGTLAQLARCLHPLHFGPIFVQYKEYLFGRP